MNKGTIAEKAAANFLVQHGLKIIATNWRCKQGEIDIIAKENQTIVFIEVRLRSTSQFGSAAESITKTKQARLISTAHYYLLSTSCSAPCRFDAVCFDGKEMTWIKDCIQSNF